MRGSLALVALVVAGCYEPPSDRCAIRCSGSAADACPSGLTCNTQGYCVGSAGDLCTSALTTVRLGAFHGCGLDAGGALYCWGDDTSGEVGLGSAAWAVPQPTRVGSDTWTALAVGGDHTCAIRGGEVYCWGQNQDGESRGTTGGIVTSPFKVAVSPTSTLPASGFQQVAAGGGFSCAIGEGQLWCWGRKDVIGIAVTYMERIGTLGDWAEISAGRDHLCGISASQGLLCWGRNDRSQAGQPNQPDPAMPIAPAIGLPTGMVPVHVAAGTGFTCVILGAATGATSGQLWCWGENGNKEVDDSGTNPITAAVEIGTATDWTTITTGTQRACGIHGGHTFCWGQSSEGGLGNGVWSDLQPATSAADLGPADDVVLGVSNRNTQWDDNACVIAGGQIRCWGGNEHGELGIGVAPTLQPTPVPVTSPNGHAWKHVYTGRRHTCGMTDDGSLWCWGEDEAGQVTGTQGTGTTSHPCVPGGPCDAPTPQAPAVAQAETVAVGYYYTCALQAGALSCWGDNDHGVLGSDSGDTLRTVQPPTGEQWTTLMGGNRASCAYTDAGKLYCWGYLYNNVTQQTPLLENDVDLQPAMVDLKFGDDFACGVRMDTKRICWGYNGHGELGDGSQTDRGDPQVIQTAPSVIDAVDAEDSHACAVTSDNGHQVMCWGDNNNSETGAMTNPTLTPTAVAKQSGALSSCTAISTGSDFACAICGGVPYCWGANYAAELGRGPTGANTGTDAEAQLVVKLTSTYDEIAAGGYHACVVEHAGGLMCWGWGFHGELGDGSHGANLPTLLAPAR